MQVGKVFLVAKILDSGVHFFDQFPDWNDCRLVMELLNSKQHDQICVQNRLCYRYKEF